MESESIISEKQNSVKFAINAKGQWSGELKVYAESIQEAIELAVEKAEDMELLLNKKNGTIGN